MKLDYKIKVHEKELELKLTILEQDERFLKKEDDGDFDSINYECKNGFVLKSHYVVELLEDEIFLKGYDVDDDCAFKYFNTLKELDKYKQKLIEALEEFKSYEPDNFALKTVALELKTLVEKIDYNMYYQTRHNDDNSFWLGSQIYQEIRNNDYKDKKFKCFQNILNCNRLAYLIRELIKNNYDEVTSAYITYDLEEDNQPLLLLHIGYNYELDYNERTNKKDYIADFKKVEELIKWLGLNFIEEEDYYVEKNNEIVFIIG